MSHNLQAHENDIVDKQPPKAAKGSRRGKKLFRAVGGTVYIYLAKGYLYSSLFYLKGCYVEDRAEMFRVGPENWTSNDGNTRE